MTKKAQRRREKRARHNKPPRINVITGKVETDMHKPVKAWFPSVGVDTAEDGDTTAITWLIPTGRDPDLDVYARVPSDFTKMFMGTLFPPEFPRHMDYGSSRRSGKSAAMVLQTLMYDELKRIPSRMVHDYDWDDAMPHSVEEPDLKPGTRVLVRPSKDVKEYGHITGRAESKYQVELCRNGEVLTLLFSYSQLTVIRRHY